MKTLLMTLFALVLATVAALAQGTLQVPFTAAQQNGVAWANDKDNAVRAAEDPPLPPIALQAYGIQQCQSLFDGYEQNRIDEAEVLANVRGTYLGNNPTYAFTDADRAAVDAFIAACVSGAGC